MYKQYQKKNAFLALNTYLLKNWTPKQEYKNQQILTDLKQLIKICGR